MVRLNVDMKRYRWKWGVAAMATFLVIGQSSAQQPPNPNYQRVPLYDTYDQFRTALTNIVNVTDPVIRNQQFDAFFQRLLNAGQVPYAIDDRVAFLYRGNANQVTWRGDFNSWGISTGQRLGDSNVWILERTLPANARTDYKLFLNNFDWRIDPLNPLIMWSGLGPNSELRMPDYAFPLETVEQSNIAKGTLSPNVRMHSDRLGYDIHYRVYTPAGYEGFNNLPVVYVTDGHEYAANYLGSLPIVLDNLIADGRVRPAMAVFVDPRDPDPPYTNRRGTEYVGNRQFAEFLADELVPRIDSEFSTEATPLGRAILGTSLGGLNSLYVGIVEHDTFGMLGIQSPAFQVYPQIYDLVRNHPHRDQVLFMSGGTLGGDHASSSAMRQVLQEQGYNFSYLEVNEGHSWGSWRGQLDTFLEATIGPPVPEPTLSAWWLLTWFAARRRADCPSRV